MYIIFSHFRIKFTSKCYGKKKKESEDMFLCEEMNSFAFT